MPSQSDSPSIDFDAEWDKLSDDEKTALQALYYPLWCEKRVERVDNRPFSFENFPFLRKIYDDNSQRRVVMKSTQLGLTVSEILRSFHKVWTGLNWIYFFPTARLVTKFVQGRFNILIANNPKLKELVKETNNNTIKQIGAGVIYFSGLGASSKEGGLFEVISNPADGVTFDEFEKMQKAKTTIALQRIEASPYKYENYISTPGIPNYMIDEKFQQSDQKLLAHKCQHCAHQNIVEQQMDTFPRCIEQGFLACEKCRQALNLRDEGLMEWVPQAPENTRLSGYHVSKLYFPLADINNILYRWKDAQASVRLLEDFYHEDLGLPYIDSTQKLGQEDILRLCGKDVMKDSDEDCYMGIDIGGSRKGCHVVIIKRHPARGWEIVFIGILKEPLGADPLDWISAEVRRLVINFKVKKFGMDAQPETRLARSICSRFKTKGWMVRYNDDQKGEYAWNEDDIANEVQVNRTESLDNSRSVLSQRAIVLPRRNEMVELFAMHCASVVRVLDEDEETLKKKYVYKHTGDADFAHALNYACIVAGIDGTQKLTPSGGVVNLMDDSFYKPQRNRGGGIKLEW